MKDKIFRDSKKRTLESTTSLTPIQHKGKVAYPYCNMKKTSCFEHYREKCPNWSIYYEVKK